MKMTGKKTLNRIALQNNKKNKSRSILMMVVICLSTMLLMSILSIGYGIVKYEKETAVLNYGRCHGNIAQVDEEQKEAIENDDAFASIGYMYSCGIAKADIPIYLDALDAEGVYLSGLDLRLEKGTLPERENEIAVSEGMLRALGMEGKGIGDTITLSVRPDVKKDFVALDFVITGFLRVQETSDKFYTGFVSTAFYDRYASKEADSRNLFFRLRDDIPLTYDRAVDEVLRYTEECEVRESQVTVNSIYILLTEGTGTEVIVVCGILTAVVILFSMIVIYNIFQISLVQRMKEYGRLKAIGTTEKQLRRLINREGMMLALPSVPLGVLLGTVAAHASFRWIVTSMNKLHQDALKEFHFFSPWILLGSMLLAFATIWLSLIRPKRTIAKISAIEAISFREETGVLAGGRGKKKAKKKGRDRQRTGNGLRKGHETANEWTLALANLAADKRQTVTTMLTMGLSCVLLVVMMNCLGNIDTEYETRKSIPHGQFELTLDFTFYDEIYPENNLDTILKDNPLNEEFVKELAQIEGVTDVMTRDRLVMVRNEIQLDAVEVLSREDFDFLKNQGGEKGILDYDLASEENQVIFGWSHFLDEVLNGFGSFDCELYNGADYQSLQTECKGAFGSLNHTSWAITEDTYEKLGYEKGSSIGTIWVDCAEKDRAYVREQIQNLIREKKHLDFEDYEDSYAEQAFGTRTMRYGIYALLAIIAFIGFMNMANTMIISITTKRREYGIMQAVGMTDRQLNRSMMLQGMIYTGGTVLVSLVVGLPAGYLAFVKFKSISGFGMNVYHVPLPELIIMVIVILLLQFSLSFILSGNLKKDSLIERIRY